MRLLFLGLSLLLSSSVLGFKVCNNLTYKQFVAVAYYDLGSYVSRGWYSVEPTECRELAFNNPSQQYYIYFEDGRQSKSVGSIPFCVQRPGPFTIQRANRLAAARRCQFERFARFQLPGNSILWLGSKGTPPQDPEPPEDNDEQVWVGEVYFEGGLLRNEVLWLDDLYTMDRIFLDLETCPTNSSILRIEARYNGQWLRAQATGKPGLYQFPNQITTNQIRASLNGPVNHDELPCFAPVYVYI
ncbi:DUF1036 domain-containing protein [Pseudobacteriovorax antillogorgiicola]|uniref:YARHG domain-containing protein n=1 Tax=Pseudobacteriovorax antillogorgiicola TaxID=1513793 RepID=A0A1Y6BTJ8_9BACT|nr:DUF1036 domain-containing protein [Pseudobacteriovorax antillogorgiicola]TCS54612.1 uncharacterized protein DUF1036 [Pseudobacteriovorax antillogorgiicola]SMF17509.1 Protein of unknown function [Pseudobacteriovorax antillogorgiicola]